MLSPGIAGRRGSLHPIRRERRRRGDTNLRFNSKRGRAASRRGARLANPRLHWSCSARVSGTLRNTLRRLRRCDVARSRGGQFVLGAINGTAVNDEPFGATESPGCRVRKSYIPIPKCGLTSASKVRAACGSSTRTDPCGCAGSNARPYRDNPWRCTTPCRSQM